MRATIHKGRALLALSLMLLLGSLSFAQIQLKGKMYQEKIIAPGRAYEVKVELVNPTLSDVDVAILKKDYREVYGKSIFLNPGAVKRSNFSWINTGLKGFILPAKQRIKLSFIVRVPILDICGTYHSLIIIETSGHVEKGKKIGIVTKMRHAIQIVTTVLSDENKKSIKISDVQVVKDKLYVDIENDGNMVLILKLISSNKEIEGGRIRIYPGMTNRKTLDISNLKDGDHKERIILDDGKDFLVPVQIEFRKGLPEEKLEELKRIGEKIARKKRRGKPYSVYANLNYGTRRRGMSLSGSLRLGGFRLSAGSTFSGYVIEDYFYGYRSFRGSANFQTRNFRTGVSGYLYESGWSAMYNAGFTVMKIRCNLAYMAKYQIISFNVSKRIFRKYNLRIYGFRSQIRKEISFSLSIPIF